MAVRGLAKLIFISVMIVWCSTAHANHIEVGGENGWAVPPEKNDDMYNHWASLNRFQVGDTIYFKYKNDSVMVVSEEAYNNCNCTHPIFFSNNGNTRYELDHSGLFYFISGEEDHCDLGQKVIIKVLGPPDDISPTGSSPDKAEIPPPPLSPPSEHKHSGTTARIRDFSRVVSVFGLFVMILIY
ncbi:early nodulin-like protein 1 [Carex littledalei]|uniref:Early nodulin-like protein 1 n=1 Tax=Carex littledalei TaxID=544730 RepID=A0A833VDM2_9POAL|nr:early nodulin-like protein 1 [Carex littledalei]